MYKTFAALTLFMSVAAFAQDYPLQAKRLKPVTATLVGVCEKHAPALGVAVFTYSDGQVLVVSLANMQGFKDAQDIFTYAATADKLTQLHQVCGDTSA